MLRTMTLLSIFILLNRFATPQPLPSLDAASEAYHKSLVLNKQDELSVDRDPNHPTGQQHIFVSYHTPHHFDKLQ